MIPLEKLHNGTITDDDYADGTYNDYVWCTSCEDECMETYTKEIEGEEG